MAGEGEPGSVQPVRRFQFSNGPAGHFLPVLIAAIFALAVIAWPAADAIRFFCVLGVIGLAAYAISRTLRHAKENPIKASLCGAEITDCRQCLGTKADPRMLHSELVANVVRGVEDRPRTSTLSTETPITPLHPDAEAQPAAKNMTLDLPPTAPAPDVSAEGRP